MIIYTHPIVKSSNRCFKPFSFLTINRKLIYSIINIKSKMNQQDKDNERRGEDLRKQQQQQSDKNYQNKFAY